MKKIIFFIMMAMFFNTIRAQAPQGITHQAVIRDAANNLVTNSPIGIRVSIIQGTPDGVAAYSETHLPTSNANGLITFVIGQGTTDDDFSDIDWSASPYFIKTEADPLGGSNYSIIGTSQVFSVPYALYAVNSGESTWEKNGDNIHYMDGKVGIGTNNPTELLHIQGENLLVSGTIDTSPILNISGDGTRMFFYPRKAAFRAGGVYGAGQWNNNNIGIYSVGMGYNSVANGAFSTSIGRDNTASGYSSSAIGSVNTASGQNTVAMGFSNVAGSSSAIAVGTNNIANGAWSTALGLKSRATGNYSFAINLSETIGPNVPDNTMQISGASKTIISDGDVGIGTDSPTEKLDINGQLRIRGGNPGTGKVLISDEDGVASWQEPLSSNWTSSGADIYRLLGNVGIGTETPDETLTISGTLKSVNTDNSDPWNHAIKGIHGVSNNYGLLGGLTFGVYGFNEPSDNHGFLATAHYGVQGINNSTGNEGRLGTGTAGVYGKSTDGNAGYFDGDVTVRDQMLIGSGFIQPDAALAVNSSDKGFLPPRMHTHQRDSIETPHKGLIIYNYDNDALEVHVGNNMWKRIVYYDEVEIFVCGYSALTDISNNVYQTIKIGNQCWMKENLKTNQYRNGTPIEYPGSDINAWENNTTGAYAWYDNNGGFWRNSYGALYNWHAVNNTNGLCPTGWHVPTDAEWTQLTIFIGGTQSFNGNRLKSCRQVDSPLGDDCNTSEHPRWDSHETHYGTDFFSFSAFPGGGRATNGSFSNIGHDGIWWSSTENTSMSAWTRYLYYNDGGVTRDGYSKGVGFSVRCIKDID